MRKIDGIPVWGDPADDGAVAQIKNCARDAPHVALVAGHHRECDGAERAWRTVGRHGKTGPLRTKPIRATTRPAGFSTISMVSVSDKGAE